MSLGFFWNNWSKGERKGVHMFLVIFLIGCKLVMVSLHHALLAFYLHHEEFEKPFLFYFILFNFKQNEYAF